ncbi:hypothetical protein Ade02nite_19860 [Paractinoplanes deccanensis]|uniref:Minor tail protein n=1 Tax=Paractinoplanes deccanensis TaxID=113561 RepID=A0ABQ3Y031_9ACTN|nr:hypothetical protein [Actinoplanes deccanensis]GID73345.1 hypothetical protein Ade02nite_19860 [Actinoplanes deccanensis]
MPYPDEDLEITAAAAFGADLTADPDTWEWTDLSDRVLADSQLNISCGLVVGQGNRRTASCTGLRLLNDDGWLTHDHPVSPWWPYVDQGTPLRVSIRTDSSTWIGDTFTRNVASGWGVADTGNSWIGSTGFSVNGTTGLATHSAVNTIRGIRVNRPHRDIDVTVTFSVPAVAAGASVMVGPMLRGGPSSTDYVWPLLDLSTAGQVRLALWTNVASSVTQAVAPIATGLTYAGGTLLRMRVEYIGRRLRAKVWLAAGSEPGAWALDTTVTHQAGGDTYFGIFSWLRFGNTNTLPYVISVDNLTVQQPRYPRVEGYIADVRNRFVPAADGATHSVAEIDISGVGGRLERKTADPLSPQRRSMEKFLDPAPVDYWPLEDKKASLSAAHAYPGGTPMTVSGVVQFEVDLGVTDDVLLSRYGSKALCSVATGGKLTAPTSLAGAVGPWCVSITTDVFARLVPSTTEIRIAEWTTPGSAIGRWALVCTATGHAVRAYATDGTVTEVAVAAENFAVTISYDVTAQQNGGNIDVTLRYNGGVFATGSIAGVCAQPTRVTINPDMRNTTLATTVAGLRFTVGHLAVRDVASPALPAYTATAAAVASYQGWAREAVHERVGRLAGVEENLPFRLLATPDASSLVLLNTQQEGGTVDLVEAAAEADSGSLLLEEEFGYVFLPRSARLNAPVDLTVDMTTYARSQSTEPGDVLQPRLGARGPNYWTVERRDGSQAVAAADQALRDRRGTVPDKVTLDLLRDSDCGPHAQWRTHITAGGTGPNYPGMSIELHANPGLIDDYLLCRIGSRVQRLNQPTIAGLDTIDQVVDGMSEQIVSRQAGGPAWTATFDTSPASVWQPGVWDGPGLLWTSDRTELAAGVTTTATSWSIDSNGDPWTTGAVSLRAQVGREEVLITNITGAGSSWTFTVVRSVNTVVTAHSAGEALTLLDTGFWAL